MCSFRAVLKELLTTPVNDYTLPAAHAPPERHALSAFGVVHVPDFFAASLALLQPGSCRTLRRMMQFTGHW